MNTLPHILIVDDDDRIRELLRQYLHDHALHAATAANADEARELMRLFRFNLIVLDIMMPGETGLEFSEALRNQPDAPPILLLTAMGEPEQRIRGLESGADDYLTKPFEPRELLLRIQAILRRTAATGGDNRQKATFGMFEFHVESGQLYCSGQPVHLTTAEAELLRLLAQSSGQPVSRTQLAALSTEAGTPLEERSVDVQINRLRKKVEQNTSQPVYIQTKRGEGYLLQARLKAL